MPDSAKAVGRFGFPHLGKFWTVSNVLSLVRLVLAIPVVYMILRRHPGDPVDPALLLLVVIAIATDWFDGKLARWSKTVSDWGKVLDPLADKIAAGFTVLALAATNAIPWWFVLMMVIRDVVTGLGWSVLSRRTGSISMSRMSGKTATAAVGVTVLAAIMVADPEVMNACIWITTTLLLYSFVDYFIHFVSVLTGRVGTEDETAGAEELEETDR
ncbi:MAG TPA: CDP-alcohol phosphatidyltransferase family protein [Rhodothermales bacterium]|nr:CDP-alcohol phosphatidyltransferase family protein [Rhodothermales bacterium]